MPQGTIQRILANDGAGVDPIDINRMSQWQRAQMIDCGFGQMARTDMTIAGIPDSRACYAYGSAAAPVSNGSNRQISCNPGTLYFRADGTANDGSTNKLIPFYVNQFDSALTFTAPTADPTNPRVDAVFIKIDEINGPLETRNWQDAGGALFTTESMFTTQVTRLTTSYVAGTPAANPTVPTTPAGFVPWCYVFVAAAFNSPFDGTNMFDARVPFGLRRHWIPPKQFVLDNAANWTFGTDAQLFKITGGSAGTFCYIHCPIGQGSRVVGYGLSIYAGNGTYQAMRVSGLFGTPFNVPGITGAGTVLTVPTNVSLSTAQFWSDSVNRLPLWGNGRGMNAAPTGDESFAIKVINGSTPWQLGGAWFEIAG